MVISCPAIETVIVFTTPFDKPGDEIDFLAIAARCLPAVSHSLLSAH